MSCKEAKAVLGGNENCYNSKSNVAEENKRKFILNIKREKASFCKIKYDDCIYTGTEQRCDYLFTVNDQQGKIVEWIFVELKGQDILNATKQIVAAINQVGNENRAKKKLSAFVVGSKVPSNARTDVQKAKTLFKMQYRGELKVETNVLTYVVS